VKLVSASPAAELAEIPVFASRPLRFPLHLAGVCHFFASAAAELAEIPVFASRPLRFPLHLAVVCHFFASALVAEPTSGPLMPLRMTPWSHNEGANCRSDETDEQRCHG